jgi:hypothetical protein
MNPTEQQFQQFITIVRKKVSVDSSRGFGLEATAEKLIKI